MQRNIPMSIYLQFQSFPSVAQQNPLFPVYFQMLWLSLAPSCSSFHRNKLQLFPLVLKPIAQEMGAHIRTWSNFPASCSLVHPSNVLVCTNCICRPLQPQHDWAVSSICGISWSLLFYPSKLSILCCSLYFLSIFFALLSFCSASVQSVPAHFFKKSVKSCTAGFISQPLTCI